MGHILQAKESNHHSTSVFLDLSKAFNTLNHEVLLRKLDQYGIQGIMSEWLKSYLSYRSLRTKINVASNQIVYSEKSNITYGMAQGSCLGPLLFILFCNDIHLLPIYGTLILFADNTTFLGVLLDEELLWTAHINHIKDKLKVNKHMLQLGKNFLNHSSIKNVYYAHIHSHLTYSLLT